MYIRMSLSESEDVGEYEAAQIWRRYKEPFGSYKLTKQWFEQWSLDKAYSDTSDSW